MVRLTITKTIANAISFCNEQKPSGWPLQHNQGNTSLEQYAIGAPITHDQLLELSRCLRNASATGAKIPESVTVSLDRLLHGSKVYVEACTPKPEPVSAINCLMSRA